jgi:hypothetical protein
MPIAVFAEPGELLASDVDVLAQRQLVAVDCIDTATEPAQASHLRTTCCAKAAGSSWSPAGPLAALPLRDLRTRLGWGVVRELPPLADDEAAALLAHAAAWVRQSADVIGYCWRTAAATCRRWWPRWPRSTGVTGEQARDHNTNVEEWLNRELDAPETGSMVRVWQSCVRSRFSGSDRIGNRLCQPRPVGPLLAATSIQQQSTLLKRRSPIHQNCTS